MERDNRKKRNLSKKDINVYYIAGGIAVLFIVVFATLYLIYGNNNNESSAIDSQKYGSSELNTIIEEASSQIGKTVEESENEINNSTEKVAVNTSNMNETNSNTTSRENKKTNKTEEKQKNENKTKETSVEEITFIKPVDGDIITEYAKDNLIFSKTLNEWITHNGIDLRAEKTEVVKAAASGTVKTIKNDPRFGLTITIEHEDGYKTVYANLLTSEFVVEGEKVEQGQSIGTVGNTAVFESLDDSHLHFEILKDNVNVDPTTLLK